VIADSQMAHVVHYLFEWAGLVTGLLIYRSIRKRRSDSGLTTPGTFAVIIGGLLGAAIGNKLVFWVDNPHLWTGHATGLGTWLTGQSIVGALLGGWLGVEIGKRISGISIRTGDDYVLPILAGLIIGRIGCFLAGLHDGTYGIPTTLPWGVDFGDGVRRHPTQLYEAGLALLALVTWPRWRLIFAHTPGLAFRVLILGYFLWRVGVDMIKPVPYEYVWGLSGVQLICMFGAALIIIGLTRDYWRRQNE